MKPSIQNSPGAMPRGRDLLFASEVYAFKRMRATPSLKRADMPTAVCLSHGGLYVLAIPETGAASVR